MSKQKKIKATRKGGSWFFDYGEVITVGNGDEIKGEVVLSSDGSGEMTYEVVKKQDD